MRDHKCLSVAFCDDACALLHQSPGKQLDRATSFESVQSYSKSNDTYEATARDMRIFWPWQDVAATPQLHAIQEPVPTLYKEMACVSPQARPKPALSLDINRYQFPGDDQLAMSAPAGGSRLRAQSFDLSTLRRRPESFDFERHGSPGIRQDIAMAKAMSMAQIAEDDMVGAGAGAGVGAGAGAGAGARAGAGAEQLGRRHVNRSCESMARVATGSVSSPPEPNLSLETATKLGLASVKWQRGFRCRCSDPVPDASCSESELISGSPDSPTRTSTQCHTQGVCSSSPSSVKSSPSRSRLSNASFAIEHGQSL